VQWLIGGSPMLINLDFPTLQAVEENNKTFDTVTKEHVYEIGEKAKWQYWVRRLPLERSPGQYID
jgi:hypothetical protein